MDEDILGIFILGAIIGSGVWLEYSTRGRDSTVDGSFLVCNVL